MVMAAKTGAATGAAIGALGGPQGAALGGSLGAVVGAGHIGYKAVQKSRAKGKMKRLKEQGKLVNEVESVEDDEDAKEREGGEKDVKRGGSDETKMKERFKLFGRKEGNAERNIDVIDVDRTQGDVLNLGGAEDEPQKKKT
ncbi:hypothetical protein B7494_g7639 [Chlorociboria aeruginascens]|nr:hypothetical protein B7494_g7639 [Chlorociboria aeruginascens]